MERANPFNQLWPRRRGETTMNTVVKWLQLCQCGCGNLTKKGNRFIRFHYLKIHNKDPAFRKYLSNFQKERFKNPQNHPCFGKILPEETKRKISNAHTGKKMSKEFRRKQSERMKKRFCNPELNPSYGKPAWNRGLTQNTDQRVAKYAKARLNQILPKKDTKPERILQEELRDRQIDGWEKHVPIEGVCQPDITFHDQKIVVFVDGVYWHGCPKYFEKLNRIQVKARKRDLLVNQLLKERGWTVIRFWEDEIIKNVPSCVDELLKVLPHVY